MMLLFNIWLIYAFFVIKNIFAQTDFPLYDVPYDRVDRIVEITVHGYSNIGNKGKNNGCCGSASGSSCNPCKYKWVAKFEQGSYEQNFDIGENSIPAESSFELFFNVYPVDSTRVEHISVYARVSEDDSWIDTLCCISTSMPIVYNYNGTMGHQGNLRIYATVNVQFLSTSQIWRGISTQLNSVKFLTFKTASGKCCDGSSTDNCPKNCNYRLTIGTSQDDFYSTSSQNPVLENDVEYVGSTAIGNFNSGYLDDVDVKIQMTESSSGELIDEYTLQNLNLIKNVDHSFFGLTGDYGNVQFAITLYYNCNQYTGYNCKYRCPVLSNFEDCDMFKGEKYCIFGQQNPPQCTIPYTACSETVCKNGGVCNMVDGQIACSCQPGYKGVLCEKYTCGDCGNGFCVGPNQCECMPGYFGLNCEASNCPEDYDYCGSGGKCIVNGSLDCICDNPIKFGKQCKEFKCTPECVNGRCALSKDSESSYCKCNKFYSGDDCTTYAFQSCHHGPFIAALVIILLVLGLPSLVLILYTLIAKLCDTSLFNKKQTFKFHDGKNQSITDIENLQENPFISEESRHVQEQNSVAALDY